MTKIGEKVSVDQLENSINEISISMGRILLKRHYSAEKNKTQWKIWRLNDDLTATLVDYGFHESHIRKLAKDLVRTVL